MPGIVEAEATMPNKSSGVPRLAAKGFRTGFLDMVELRMAKNPIAHRIRKKTVCDRLVLRISQAIKIALKGDISYLLSRLGMQFINPDEFLLQS